MKQQTADHPEAQAKQAVVDSLRQTISQLTESEAELLRNSVTLAEAEVREQSNLIEQTEAQYQRYAGARTVCETLNHKAQAAKALYDDVLKRMKFIELIQKDNSNPVRVIDEATVPTRPVYPLRRLALLGFGGGAILLFVGLLLVRERAPTEALPA